MHYDSLTGSGNVVIARNLVRKLELENTRYQEGQMAQQGNGYDCGVLVLDATRELVTRLLNGEPESLDLRSVVADRTALLAGSGPDEIAALMPRRPRQSKAAWADALKAA
ncbi:hypothetical protein, partial [Rhizobium johnstonii]|uniref:hypothetical protein n=1 Tax=Rhizobium johnstonii TaxID=3019933 RepID=UPI003F975E64